VSTPIVLAVDGGNSKTDLALVAGDGTLLSLVRGPLGSPHHIGVTGTLELLDDLLGKAAAKAGIDPAAGPLAEVAAVALAGLDLPSEEDELRNALQRTGWARRIIVHNDTFAVLRAGTEQGWGVAVVCGAGINCVGVTREGRQARFLALGTISGDWGGGHDVGLAALSAAARSADRRGPRTVLEHAVPAHFGLTSPDEVAEAIHLGRISVRRMHELAPIVLAEAGADAVASQIVQRLVDEIAAMARAALERLDLTGQGVEVILGGGLLQFGDGRVAAAAHQRLTETDAGLVVRVASSPPIVGAALLGLDELGADHLAQEKLRAELGRAATQFSAAR
jgi:N-acetylglucosamine kinase-like BadF-type ATPase